MKKILILLFLVLTSLQPALQSKESSEKLVTATKRIYLPDEYQGAHNPSIIEYGDGYLLSFRHIPKRNEEPWISYIGLVVLNEDFDPISPPQLLNTRLYSQDTPSQSEDARIFSANGRIYVVYNDNIEVTLPYPWERRDMFIAEILYDGEQFFLEEPCKLVHENIKKHRDAPWQKNWSPFEWQDQIMLVFQISPLEVLSPNLKNGRSKVVSLSEAKVFWELGDLRGGTPAQIVEGEYLAFFHTGAQMKSASSDNMELWHYFMGAYTFSASPPFELTSISQSPILSPEFYTYSSYLKRIIYPGGFVVKGSTIYLAYGKDDCEICIATIPLKTLLNSLIPVY